MWSGVLYWTPRNGSLSIGFCKYRRNNIRGGIINLRTMNLWTVNFVCNKDIFINALNVLIKSLYQTYFIFITVLYLLFYYLLPIIWYFYYLYKQCILISLYEKLLHAISKCAIICYIKKKIKDPLKGGGG